jgi:hypothetical protein
MSWYGFAKFKLLLLAFLFLVVIGLWFGNTKLDFLMIKLNLKLKVIQPSCSPRYRTNRAFYVSSVRAAAGCIPILTGYENLSGFSRLPD